jgi:carbonic anhydrase
MINRLKKGLHNFHQFTYKKYEDIYHDLEDTQHPHTLFISCSDSRVNPSMLIDSEPGEIFSIRNIANTVPKFEDREKDFTTLSAIEYAVEVLNVEQIILCGHSNCGGCAAALTGIDKLSDLPYTQEYLKSLQSVKESIDKKHSHIDEADRAKLMETENIIEQLKHLKEYPMIKNRLKNKTLEIEGWHYDIGSGTVLIYDEELKDFIESTD